MVERVFFDSQYRFTDPVRYFKANDPYYYEVDNIPLKQLQENNNWLKSQVEGLLGASGSILEFDRENFSELKPYVDGTDNLVKVKSGKYTARINDAYSIEPLQILSQVLGQTYPENNAWEVKTTTDTILKATLDKFKSTLASNALNTNGLLERTFTFAMRTQDVPTQYSISGSPGYNQPNLTYIPYPNFTSKFWVTNTPATSRNVFQFISTNPTQGYFNLGWTEVEFTRRWRGITRTSIVNVENELQVEIPPFDNEDFFYTDEQGNKVPLTANQRIDLVFIYSKPIDVSSTTISKFVGNTPTIINQPILGIVKGAGLGVNFKQAVTPPFTDSLVNLQDSDGNALMLPSVADENATNIGFGNIKGSFPSPDDLMNLAPLLSENLETTNFALIGQSILPVAYIVVRRSANLNANSVNIISTSDLIDIRPFFRTTELAYNERAGIAAATPQISIANPVASEGYVDKLINEVYSDYTSKISQNTTNTIDNPTVPRMVGTGYVKGGYRFGVESVLGNFIQSKFNINTESSIKQEIVSRYGYPQGTIISNLPDWDIAEWCNRGNFVDKGVYPNDRINFHAFGPNFAGSPLIPYACYDSPQPATTRANGLGVDRVNGGTGSEIGNSLIYFVKKTIQIDRTQIQWARDYQVDVQLHNCAPLSCRTHKDSNNNISVAGNAAIWIDKRPTEFTIFVSWVAADQYNTGTMPGVSIEPGDSNVFPHQSRGNGHRFIGFSIINKDMLTDNYVHRVVDGESAAGVAIYPTISFQVYGIPAAYSTASYNLNGENSLLVLK